MITVVGLGSQKADVHAQVLLKIDCLRHKRHLRPARDLTKP